ncbi:MAG TPA: CHAT domain-containing protein [Trichormus sp. M33_DOE_039]|nr:CHAT domain-containing protein [Trichormus sp. M33_DOE_039]
MLYLQFFWHRRLRIIVLTLLGLVFSLGVHILPASSRLTPIPDQTPGKQFPIPANTEQLVQKGKTFYQAGQFKQAMQSFQQAAQIYNSQKDILNQALVLNYLSLAEQKLGQWQQATEAITISLDLLNNSQLNTNESKHILALTHNTKGSLQLALGHTESALESWQTAAKIYSQIGEQAAYTGSLINQATALQSLGRYRSTMKIFAQIEQGLESQPDSLVKAVGLRSLGNALRASGDLDRSQQVLGQSLAVAQRLRSPQEESATLLSLGNTFLSLANRSLLRETTKAENSLPLSCGHQSITASAKTYYGNAIDSYQQSVEKSTSPVATVQAQLNHLRVLLYVHQQPTSEELNSIKSTLATLSPSRATVYAGVNLAQSLQCINQGVTATAKSVASPDESLQLLNKAIQQAKNITDQRAESYALGHLGQLYEKTQQWAIARKYTESALSLAQMLNAADIAYQWQWQLGRILLAQRSPSEAVAAYTEAVTSLKSLRSDLVALNPDLQFDFRDQVEPVYRQLVALLLQPKTPSFQNLNQARSVIEALQLAELDNFFRDACIAAQPTQIDEIVDNANPATAVIYPIILADRLEVIVKLPRKTELSHYRTYIAKTEVETTLDNLRQKLEARYTFRDREVLSQEVYNWLIKPAEQVLEQNQIKTLVFVLDGSLRNIPMAALHDGKKYLVEKYSVTLSPGLQLIDPKQQKQRFEALAGGLTESRLGFSPLPNVATELQELQSVIPTKQFLNQTFTNTTIENQVSSDAYPIVHLATHGKFSSQLEDTFILAWDGKINAKQLREILQTREDAGGRQVGALQPIELLVLSACETATGDKRAALGLAGIAVRSGARSTLASLWQVDDQSTSVLMGEFYRQLKNNPNVTKAEALRRAQESILRQHEEHPFYWAPYVLVGNWL